MNILNLKSLAFFTLAVALLSNSADAQRKAKKRSGYSSGYSSSYGNSSYGNSSYGNTNTKKTTTDKTTKKTTDTQSGYTSGYGNSNNQSGYGATAGNDGRSNIDTTLPVEVVNSGSGLLGNTKPSMRNDQIYSENDIFDGAVPLEYQKVRQTDVPFKIRVWRDIDAREKINSRFNYDGEDDNGNRRFINILLRAIRDNGLTAFNGDDDRFTTPITFDDAMKSFGSGMDTSAVYDMEGNITSYQARNKAVDPDSIYKFRIKEDWFFDRNTSKLYVRIIGIAPIISYRLSTGEIMPNSEHAAFWVYYPDLRPVLVREPAYNQYNPGALTSWEDVFESREFSGYIVKSDLNNPKNLAFKATIKDPINRLYEGEKVKNHIFDYEQSLWSY
jgi:gliding motility associated protien GldN